MPVRSAQADTLVEDVVFALTGVPSEEVLLQDGHPEPGPPTEPRDLVERAATDVDKRTAAAYGRTLMDCLSEDPGNLRQLEALMILGLAHPEVLKRHRVSLAEEGRRLASLLERSGQLDRARGMLELVAEQVPSDDTIDQELAGLLRRSGKTTQLIERYLARSEECTREGNIEEAIPWLQEILLLDRTRRDVARMIRDLRYQQVERGARSKRRNRAVLIVLLVSSLITAIGARENRIRAQIQALPVVEENKPETLYGRYAGLSRLLDEYVVWSNVITVAREQKLLKKEIEQHEAGLERMVRVNELERDRLHKMAESSRLRGLMNAERGDFKKALEDFQRSLAMCSTDWEHRAQLLEDITALEDWEEEKE